ncbi:MAG: hypothetical protein HOV67_16760 [Kribbellaceae bacterium]|nr:hypothetical protein [Kribbellaceae bacterium]
MSTYDPPYAIARTAAEAALYLELSPCPDCGSTETDWQDQQTAEVLTCSGICEGCGAFREYLFSRPLHPYEGFGGAEPSELIDAGQWLEFADGVAGQVAVGDLSDEAVEAMAVARQAVEEVVKFVPPTADAVPDEAFWTDAGRAVRALDPGRFRLERLLVIRDSYSD